MSCQFDQPVFFQLTVDQKPGSILFNAKKRLEKVSDVKK